MCIYVHVYVCVYIKTGLGGGVETDSGAEFVGFYLIYVEVYIHMICVEVYVRIRRCVYLIT